MIPIKTLLGYFLGAMALAVIYLKRALIFELIREKIEFQRQYNSIHKEAYQEEKLKQAKVQGVLKARTPGLLNAGLGSNLKKLAEQDPKPKKKKVSKKKKQTAKEEPEKSNIEKLMGL